MKTLAIPLLLGGLVWTAQAQTQTAPKESVVVRDVKALPSWKSLKFPPLKEVPIPKPLTFTLPNGMRVYLLEDHELPLVSGTALVRTGNLFDPSDKRGLADLTGTVMRTGGTKEKSGDELDVQLENIAASVETQIGESSGRASFSCLRENTDEVLAVFHDVMTSPEFRQDKLDLAETQMRGAISRRNDDAHGILQREFASIVYGRNTPYGWDIEYSDVDNIHRDDLIKFYKRYFFPGNIMLAVYGDFSSAAMKEKLEKLFAGWTYSQPKVPPFPPVTEKPAPGIFLATKTDVTQTFFAIGELGGELRDKDFPALEVAADILGSGFTSRLVDRVRTKLGYAYSINASWAANYDHPGTFQISGSTKSATTADTLAIVREEVDKMRAAEVSDAELQTARERVLNSFVFFFDRPSKTLNRLVLYDYFAYPKDFIFQYEKAIRAVTRADVLRVARQYWHPKELTLVAVGNPKEFGKPLTALNLPVHDIDLTIPEPKSQEPEAKVDAESVAKGKQLIERVQTALGGAEKLASVKDTDWSADVDLQAGPGGVMKAKQRNLLLLPNLLRQEQELPFGKMTAYSDGKTGWIASPRGVMPMNPAVIHQVQGEIFRNLFTLVLSDSDASRTVTAVSDDTVEISDKSGNRVRLVLDPKTGLPTKEVYQGGAAMGGPAEVVENLSGWRDVSGIKVPFQMSITQGGKKATDVMVTDYKLNTGLKPEDLSKKP